MQRAQKVWPQRDVSDVGDALGNQVSRHEQLIEMTSNIHDVTTPGNEGPELDTACNIIAVLTVNK